MRATLFPALSVLASACADLDLPGPTPDGDESAAVDSVGTTDTGSRDSGAADSADTGAEPAEDADGDGWSPAEGDCDDADPEVVPGAAAFHGLPAGYWAEDVGSLSGPPALADLDGDGVLDLALPVEDTVPLYRGDGSGSFEPHAEIALEEPAVEVALVDVDGDGWVDLAALLQSGNVVLHRNITGALEESGTITATGCASPSDLSGGDLDGDGLDDLAVACADPALVTLRSDGSGAFAASTLVPSHVVDLVRLGDLDGDGDLDAAAAAAGDRELTVTLWQNDGDAGWAAHELELWEPTWTLALVDADGDDDVDVVAGHYNDRDLVWFRNDGGWTFERRVAHYSDGLDTNQTLSLLPLDLDGDGRDEIISTSAITTYAWWAEADGPVYTEFTWWANATTWPAAGDLDGDGLDDLVVASYDGEVTARAGLGTGRFRTPTWIEQEGIAVIASGDLDGDGLHDVVTLDDDGLITLYRSEGDGFSTIDTERVGAGIVDDLVLADLDGDGDLDVASTTGDGWIEIGWMEGGGISAWESLSTDGLTARTLTVADVNGDGDADLLATGTERGDEWLLVILSEGGGALSVSAPTTLDENDTHLGSGDFDGDGDTDLLRGGPPASELELWLGDSSGGFALEATIELDAQVSNIAVGDVDGDGINEAVVAPWMGAELLLARWDGTTLTTTRVAEFEGEYTGYWLVLSDLTGDGVLDLASGDVGGDPTVLVGDGTGAFTSSGMLDNQLLESTLGLVALDVEGDGDQDLALAGGTEGVQVFVNECR